MKRKNERIILYSIVIILLVSLSLILLSYFLEKDYNSFLWVCYTAILLICIGIIFKKPNLILIQIIILLIPDLLWVMDVIFILITGKTIFGFGNTYFLSRPLLQQLGSLQHFFTVPLSLVALSFMKIKKNYKVLLASFIELIIFFILTSLSSSLPGINCLPLNCTSLHILEFIPYQIRWFAFGFSFITISYFIITSLPFVKKYSK